MRRWNWSFWWYWNLEILVSEVFYCIVCLDNSAPFLNTSLFLCFSYKKRPLIFARNKIFLLERFETGDMPFAIFVCHLSQNLSFMIQNFGCLIFPICSPFNISVVLRQLVALCMVIGSCGHMLTMYWLTWITYVPGHCGQVMYHLNSAAFWELLLCICSQCH